MSDQSKEKTFSTIQTFLKNPPVIIWGAGATVPFGLPTMEDLNNTLKNKLHNFNQTNENLETELGKAKYNDQMPEIRRIIWNTVNNADAKVRRKLVNGETDTFDSIKNMIEKIRSVHPQVVNIITTNYDRVIEHVMGFYGIPFTDGFGEREFNIFNGDLFTDKNITNLIKVHGSLSWFRVDSSVRYLMMDCESSEPVIISPGKNKYQEAYKTPYRDLIQKSDNLINNASSFLVVGFGFNDEHLTPKIKEKVNSGTPLVLITKKITQSCRDELKNAQKYILLQESETTGQTSVLIKTGKDESKETLIIDDDYWQLNKFMEIL